MVRIQKINTRHYRVNGKLINVYGEKIMNSNTLESNELSALKKHLGCTKKTK